MLKLGAACRSWKKDAEYYALALASTYRLQHIAETINDDAAYMFVCWLCDCPDERGTEQPEEAPAADVRGAE